MRASILVAGQQGTGGGVPAPPARSAATAPSGGRGKAACALLGLPLPSARHAEESDEEQPGGPGLGHLGLRKTDGGSRRGQAGERRGEQQIGDRPENGAVDAPGGVYAVEEGAVLRVDYSYTGEYFGRNFNKRTDRIPSYDVLNAQITLNGPENRWFVRGFVQNLTDNDAVTGIYVTNPSSGMFTNIFTLEPRRYGVAAGVRF